MKISQSRKCLVGLLVPCSLAVVANCSEGQGPTFRDETVKLGKVPSITLDRHSAPLQQTAATVRKLISDLARLDSPDYGLSATMDSQSFAPIDGSERGGVFLFTDHQIKRSETVRELVKLGPVAMPFLLDSLDDKTATHITIHHDDSFGGGMRFENEVRGNPANATEQRALASIPTSKKVDDGFAAHYITSYTVKVGDVCFVIIGQIVGRHYPAVRYQPSGCVVVNSPTHDPTIARQVRAIWSSDDASQHLLDSLLIDYSTTGSHDDGGVLSSGLQVQAAMQLSSDLQVQAAMQLSSDLQVQAAMRLLFYFPRETAPLIAKRLRGLKVHGTGPRVGSPSTESQWAAWKKREAENGVSTKEFIKAVVWCKEPVIRTELLNIFQRTMDSDILVQSSAGIDAKHQQLVQKRLVAFIDTLAPEGDGAFGDGYKLLVALGKHGGDEVKPVFKKYLDSRSMWRCRSMCHVLRKTHGEWAVELLSPLLTDKRPADGWTYAVRPEVNRKSPDSILELLSAVLRRSPRLPIRICDEAAETISRQDADITFSMVGTHEDLDRQIAVILGQRD